MAQTRCLQTPKRTFETLEVLAEMEVTTFSELATQLEYPNSTIYDYVQTLKNTGYIVEDDGKLRVSAKLLGLGKKGQKATPLYDIASVRVEELATQTGEWASFVVEENQQCIIAHLAKGSEAVDFGLYMGMKVPLSTTAPGKAILAQYELDQVTQLLDNARQPDSDSRVDRDALFKELAEIREQGYACDQEDRLDGIRGIAAPIICDGTVRGALAMGGPAVRISGERFEEELPERVREASNKVEIEAAHASPRYSNI